jgi:hypothetical protein
MHDPANMHTFAGIGELAETTLQLLSLDLQYDAVMGERRPASRQVKHYVLQQARDHMGEVREGFVFSVRTSQISDRREIRFLLERVLTDWENLQEELGLVGDQADEIPPEEMGADAYDRIQQVRSQLLAFGMASVALGYLPRMAAEQITFPYSHGKPPTYADIPAPDSPGEMLWRIDEVNRMLWEVMAGDARDLVKRRYNAVRRVYGFFEASALLASRESKRFGLKS